MLAAVHAIRAVHPINVVHAIRAVHPISVVHAIRAVLAILAVHAIHAVLAIAIHAIAIHAVLASLDNEFYSPIKHLMENTHDVKHLTISIRIILLRVLFNKIDFMKV